MNSMYERLGRSEGIRALVETIAGNHLANPIVAKRFEPLAQNPERLGVALQHMCNFLESASGGPAKYTGRSMVEAHTGMNISGEEYLAVIDDIMAAMTTRGIDEATKKDALAMVYELKSTIMKL
jgi:hemoglobin